MIEFGFTCSVILIHQQHQSAVDLYINHPVIVHRVHTARKFIQSHQYYYIVTGLISFDLNELIFIDFRSPRSLSPANQAGSCYDDIDDYSPVVSDIEDQNDDDMDCKAKTKRKDDLDKDNNDILQKILNEQSASKCELEEENVSDQGDHDDIDDIKDSK